MAFNGLLPKRAARLVRLFLDESGVSMAEMGRRGVPESSLYQALRGRNISLTTLDRIAEAAGYEVTGFKVRRIVKPCETLAAPSDR